MSERTSDTVSEQADSVEVPRIVTSRWDLADGFTLERYLDTGGYAGLRKALDTMTPAQVAEEV